VYVVADDVDQARGDLIADWSTDRRQRWAIDTGTPTTGVADVDVAPDVPSRLQMVIREARLKSERDAVARAIPPDVSHEVERARRSLVSLTEQREGLETGRGGYLYTPEGRAAVSILGVMDRIEDAQRRADDHRLRRSERRDARRQIEALGPQLEAASTTGTPSPDPSTPASPTTSSDCSRRWTRSRSNTTSTSTGLRSTPRPSVA
jgi:hypothetical protein